MDDLERETAPPPELKRRVVRSLRTRGLLAGGRRRTWGAAGRAAAALALLAGGWAAGRASAAPDLGPAAAPGEPYLLVLHEDAGFRPDRPLPELVREYAEWAGALRERGALVAAEPLDGWSETLPSPAEADGVAEDAGGQSVAGTGALGPMTGFFLIRAEDREAAVATARTHPHLAYGGRIRVLGTGEP